MDYELDLYQRCFEHLLRNEGGYVNDPDDSGGETYKGISRKFWPYWIGWKSIDSLKKHSNFPEIISQKTIIDISVKAFYKVNFWDKMNLKLIVNENSVLQLFDMAINSGIKRAVKIAQRVCGVAQDGIIGPLTAFQINSMGYQFTDQYIKGRIEFYESLVEKKPRNKKFLSGWIRRAQSTKFTK